MNIPMKKTNVDSAAHSESLPVSKTRKPYTPPRIEKRQSVARVTLLSGMGATTMGVISMMN